MTMAICATIFRKFPAQEPSPAFYPTRGLERRTENGGLKAGEKKASVGFAHEPRRIPGRAIEGNRFSRGPSMPRGRITGFGRFAHRTSSALEAIKKTGGLRV